MDPLTHAISGIALARALPRHHLPKRYVAFIALLAMAPDADYFLRFISDAAYLHYHRGVTHSLLMLPLWVWLIVSLMPKRRLRDPVIPWLIAAALALHILLDLVTSFGTMIYAPFSDARIAWDAIFIIDPLFTGALALPLLLAMFRRRHARLLAWSGLFFASAYLGLALTAHHYATQLAWRDQPAASEVHALPQPFSPLRWQLVATYSDHYSRAAVNFWPAFTGSGAVFSRAFVRRYSGDSSPPARLQWRRFPAMRTLPGIRALPGARFYLWFARFPILLERGADRLAFGDLRFGAGVLADSPFRLEINTGKKPRAWLIWREGRRSELP